MAQPQEIGLSLQAVYFLKIHRHPWYSHYHSYILRLHLSVWSLYDLSPVYIPPCLQQVSTEKKLSLILISSLFYILFFSLSVVWRAQVLYWPTEVEWFAGEAHAKSYKISAATEGYLQQNTGRRYERTY